MATPPSPDTVTLFRLIGDGEWHDYDTVRDAIALTIPPGRALRKYEERVEYKRKAIGDPGYDTRASEDERQLLGAKACAQIVITSWKGRGVMHRFFKGRKQIAVRPGFTSWGLEAKGVLTPTTEDSEPSETPPQTQDEPSEPEELAPPPEWPLTAGPPELEPVLIATSDAQDQDLGRQVGDALRGIHQSHGELEIDQRTGEGTCLSCRYVVIPAGFPAMVTDAGWDPCRKQTVEEPPPVKETPTVDIAIPTLKVIPAPEMDFVVRTADAVGDASVRDAIARAEMYFPKEPLADLTLRGEPDLTPRDETVYRLIEEVPEAAAEPAPVDAVAEPEPALSEPVEPVAPRPSFMQRLGLDPLPPEIVQRADELWAEMTAEDDAEEPSQPVTEEPVVTPCADEPQNVASLPDDEQAPLDAEMALFRESEIRHLVQEEVSKAIDAFQLGMEQYLADQFEQLSMQIGQLRASRGKWVFHPLKD